MRKFCLYRHYNKQGILLYIGKSNSFFQRLSQHKTESGWFDEIYQITIEHFNSKSELNLGEKVAIKAENPRHNKINNDRLPQKKLFPKIEAKIPYHIGINCEKIDFELKRLGWSRSQLAQKMGVSRQRLSYVLSHSYPKLEMLERMAATIQVPARDLLE